MVIQIPCTPEFEETLRAALDGLNGQPAEIVFDGARYFFRSGIHLTEAMAHVTFTGQEGTRLIGGRLLERWTPVKGTPDAARFDGEAAEHILVCDLAKLGITAVGGYESRGFARLAKTGHAELFMDGTPMTLSQYPKGDAYLPIDKVGETTTDEWGEKDGVMEQGFHVDDPRVRSWKPAPDIQALGYWKYDWASSAETVASINPDTGHVMTRPPYGNYGFRTGQRVRFYHIAEEVLAPGDYYIDHQALKAYIYPDGDSQEIILSELAEPLFDLIKCPHVTLRNLTIEAVRGSAVSAYHSSHLTVDNCVIKNVGNYGIDLCDCRDARIINNTISFCGDGGIIAMGGNRTTLEMANVVIDNNHIHHVARWSRCYVGGVRVNGVGFAITHNLIHDCPHSAILFDGNEMTMDHNEIYSAVLETGDAGAVYSGRDYTCRGNSVSHNFIHHLGGVGMGAMGIYNDDCLSGTRMHSNYFMELTRACMLGGGRDFAVSNNVFVKCEPAVSFDSRGASQHPTWIAGTNNSLRPLFYEIHRYSGHHWGTQRNQEEIDKHQEEVTSAVEEPYRSRYPGLALIDEAYRTQPFGKVMIPGQADVSHNVFCAKPRFRYRMDETTKTLYDNGMPVENTRQMRAYMTDPRHDVLQTIAAGVGDLRLNGNYNATPDDFVDPEWGDIRVKPTSSAFHHGYTDGDLESIGLVAEKRRHNPPTVYSTLNRDGLGLRNVSDQRVTGVMRLLPDKGVTVDKNAIAFDLAPGEEAYYPVAIVITGDDPRLAARSHTPGVRPCNL